MKALGIDVGLHYLDIVLIGQDCRVQALRSHSEPDELSQIVSEWRPDVVAIDSPPRWAPPGGRETERQLRRLNLQLFATPTAEARSTKGFHDWMAVGMAAFEAISSDYPLFNGGDFKGRAIEVFPHASATVLAGHLMPEGRRKGEWRRNVLGVAGVSDDRLRTVDLIDASLAALTGLYALRGQVSWYGNSEEGVIVLPANAAELPHRYVRGDRAVSGGQCFHCGAGNPPESNFCNRCGSTLKAIDGQSG